MAMVAAARHRFEPWNDPTATPFIRLIDVSKSFGPVKAVDRVSIDIFRGEFFALLGPSGCGKTTLLRMLAGFETLSEGRIELDGEDLSRVPPYERPVNMMFQSYALFPHMTVAENIGFGLKMDRTPKAEISHRVDESLALVKLESLATRKPHQLSGGQRQRVALARALIKRPKLLLLDEPLAALDRRLREHTQFELMNIQDQLGITFVIVTHDQEEAMTVASRIAVMEGGRLKQVATPPEIYEFPNSRYVAEFIGDANIFEGRIVEANRDSTRIHCADLRCDVLVDRGHDAALGATVWAAFRPEKLRIAKDPPLESKTNAVMGRVIDVGYLGDMSVYHVRLNQGPTLTVAQANQQRLVERPITWDDDVWVSWSPSAGVVLLS